jgi:hypothetical protein
VRSARLELAVRQPQGLFCAPRAGTVHPPACQKLFHVAMQFENFLKFLEVMGFKLPETYLNISFQLSIYENI